MAFVPNVPQQYLPPVSPAQPDQTAQTEMPLGAPSQTEEPLALGEEGTSKNSSVETIDRRAQKFKYGLGDLLQKSKDEIYQNLQDGREDELRATAATTLDERKRQATENLITKTTANKQGPLSPEERSGLVQIIQNMSQTTNPDTVLETAYGKQFMAALDRAAESNPDNVYTDAKKASPELLAKIANDHTDLIAKQQIIDTLTEDTKDTLKHQGWLGFGYDVAKGMIPGYYAFNLQGLAGVGSFVGLGKGSNLEEQRKVLLRLPADEMHDKMKTILESLSANPQLQLAWLEAMKGQSANDEFINNWSTPVEFIGTGIGAKTGKAISKVVSRTLKGGEELEKAGLAKRAIEDVTKAAANPNASKSTIEAAAGDLKESAVTRATTNLTADLQNVPDATKRGVESLASTHRADVEAAKADPGKFGQDIVNRIEERGDQTMSNLIETAIKIQKNERLPDVLSNESSVRLIIDDMIGKYRNLKNSVIDTSKIYKEHLSNTYLVDFHLGNNDGSYFTQKSVAENFIKYHKLGGADIIEGTERKFTKPSIALDKLDKDIKAATSAIEKNAARMEDTSLSAAERQKALEQYNGLNEHLAGFQEKKANIVLDQSGVFQTATVEQQGLGFYVKITKPVDETSPVIRDAIAQTGNTKIPDSPVAFFLNNWIGRSIGARVSKIRTPEEVLSKAERENRLTTTYAPSEYFKIMIDNAKDIQSLQAGRFSRGSKRKRWEEWQRGLENAQELPDQLDPSRKGYFFQSPGEMESYWQQWFHRLPDEQEIGAYFEFKRGMEMDRVLRNIAEHRNQSRVGTETHNIILRDAAGNEVRSTDFNGVLRQKLPGSTDGIAIFTGKIGEERITSLAKLSTAAKKDIQKDMDSGNYKLIELYDPRVQPLSGFSSITDERLRYVLVPQVETRALDWNHIPRRGGGHVQYDYDFYIKQAKIKADSATGSHWYDGDTTIMAVTNQGVGGKVAEHLNQVRKFLKDKNEDAARDYSNKNLHVGWDQVKSWFVGYKDPEGKYQVPRLSLNEDIHVVPKNKKITDIDNDLRFKYHDFRDGTREGSLAAQNQIEFAQERDAFELLGVNVEGTRANPLYKIAPADKVDPITTMNRGLARIAKSNFMDDYKTMAVEHWLQQAKNHLDVKNEGEIFHSPFYHYNETKFLSSTPPDLRYRLEAARYHTQQLVGQPSLGDTWLLSMSQKLADASFGAFGPKGLVITPTWLLPKLKDPFALARGLAFHEKLGLFNIPQFIVQSGNFANILGIAGYKYAAPGTMAAQFHFWSRVNSNPAFIEHLDNLATKFFLPGASKWKPGEFKEALAEMNHTGFGNVGGEYAALDNMMSTKIIENGPGKILDWGTIFFKGGEQNARYGAWYTAFKEFRDKNPFGRITNEDRAEILQRADLLNINMSRASSSAIHKGIFSIPTQFYTYQIRLTELMFGSRLTAKERARLFITNAALFGVPMAAGTTSLPIADYLRKKYMENGYVVGDNYLESMLMEGIPSAIGAMITGKGDPQAGTWYDVGPRFGTKGLEFLGSATGTDKSWLDVLGGPAYSIIKGHIAQSSGLARAVLSMMKQDDEVFPPVVEDVVDVFKEITTVNSLWRIYAATQFGRWVSKKDAYLADTSPAQAIFGATFGVKDVNINDIQLEASSIKDQANYEKEVEERFRKEFRRGVLAQNDNPELGKKFFTRAAAWLAISGYREDRISSVMSKALSDSESVLDKTNMDFYIKKTPDAQAGARYEAFRKKLQLQDKKSGEQ